jgi:hypothetical protein
MGDGADKTRVKYSWEWECLALVENLDTVGPKCF